MRDEDKAEEQLIEEKLKETKDYLSSVIDELPVVTLVVDTDFVVKAWNKASENYTSVKKEGILGRNFFEVIPSLEKLGWDRIFREVMETGVPYTDKDYKIVRTFGPHKGETWHQEVTVAPLVKNKEVAGAIIIINDVTERKKAEDELKAFKELNEKIVESSPVGIHVIDRNFVVRSWNSYFENYTTIRREDIIGKNLFEAIPALAKDGWDEKYRKVMETGEPFEKLGYRYVRSIGPKKGDVLYQTTRIVPLRQKNEIAGAITILGDITELKRAQESLEKSEEKYRNLVMQSKDAVFVGDAASGAVTYANPACLDIFGYAPEEFMSDPAIAAKIVHPDYRQQFNEFWENFAKTRVFPEHSMEWAWVRKDGRVVYTENTFTNLFSDKGEVIGFQTVARDITGRRRTEEELQKINEFNRSIIKALPFGMDIVDEEGNILYLSEKFESLFGREAIGKKCWNVYRDSKKQCSGCPLKEEIRIGEVKGCEAEGILDGKTFQITHIGIMYNGKKTVLEIFNDITNYKRAEKEIIREKEDLESMNKLMIGRELKMIELKKEINALLQELGKKKKYEW